VGKQLGCGDCRKKNSDEKNEKKLRLISHTQGGALVSSTHLW
jgi:hypothetical protein